MTEHPVDHPGFSRRRYRKLFYLAHPLATDDDYNFDQNMNHVVKTLRFCYEAGLCVVAPYHTISLALDDNNLDHRRIGLEVDCELVLRLDGIILVGHKLSRGMKEELMTAQDYSLTVFNLIGKPDRFLVSEIEKLLHSTF
jgi:hypothetical protein